MTHKPRTVSHSKTFQKETEMQEIADFIFANLETESEEPESLEDFNTPVWTKFKYRVIIQKIEA